uniref:Glutaredoxin domain-containing protein n=1 Tax=Setaria digitata TaxID=48799 RepID=A0A915Q2R1_9BILA
MGQFLSTISPIDEGSIRKEVKHFPVVIFTLPRCPYCVQAKQLLDMEHIEYKENDLDAHQREFPTNHQSYINGLIYITKQTSVPQIFICGEFIGGFTELQKLKNAGSLLDAIAKCQSPPINNFK